MEALLQSLVQFTFFVGYIALGAAFVFFLAERSNVAPEHRTALTLSAIIVGIAAFHYYYMKAEYVPGQAFPTEYRYIDWIITTPLMLMKFPALLGIRSGKGLLVQLVILDIIMIVTGYIGEVSGAAGGSLMLPMWIVATLAWLGIIGILFGAVRSQAAGADEDTRSAIRALTLFVTFGWAIYPIGYLFRFFGTGVAVDIVQLVYNLGDMVNKIGFGIVVYLLAVKAARRLREQQGELQAA